MGLERGRAVPTRRPARCPCQAPLRWSAALAHSPFQGRARPGEFGGARILSALPHRAGSLSAQPRGSARGFALLVASAWSRGASCRDQAPAHPICLARPTPIPPMGPPPKVARAKPRVCGDDRRNSGVALGLALALLLAALLILPPISLEGVAGTAKAAVAAVESRVGGRGDGACAGQCAPSSGWEEGREGRATGKAAGARFPRPAPT